MPTIKGDLIMESDTIYTEPLIVEGSIMGKNGARYNLAAEGNIIAKNINARTINAWKIYARDIDAWNIYAWNIYARDIDAMDINAMDIYARDIDAWNIDARNIYARDIDALFILCEALHQKEGSRLVAAHIVKNKSKYEKREMRVD